jgi:hypothetical protein
MAKKSPFTHAVKHIAKTSKRTLGEPMCEGIAEQVAAKPRSMEAPQQDVSGNRGCNGGAVERIRIVCADELPRCECCEEPWCPTHAEHYAECSCIGPHNAEDFDIEIIEEDSILWGIRSTKHLKNNL